MKSLTLPMTRSKKQTKQLIVLSSWLATKVEELVSALVETVTEWLELAPDLNEALENWADATKSVLDGVCMLHVGYIYFVISGIAIFQQQIFNIEAVNNLLENRLWLTLATLYVDITGHYKDTAMRILVTLSVAATLTILGCVRSALLEVQSNFQSEFLYICLVVLLSGAGVIAFKQFKKPSPVVTEKEKELQKSPTVTEKEKRPKKLSNFLKNKRKKQ